MFHQSVVTSVLSFDVACWGNTTSEADLSKLDKLIRWSAGLSGYCGTEEDIALDNDGHSAHFLQQPERSVQRKAAASKVQDHQMEELLSLMCNLASQLLTGRRPGCVCCRVVSTLPCN